MSVHVKTTTWLFFCLFDGDPVLFREFKFLPLWIAVRSQRGTCRQINLVHRGHILFPQCASGVSANKSGHCSTGTPSRGVLATFQLHNMNNFMTSSNVVLEQPPSFSRKLLSSISEMQIPLVLLTSLHPSSLTSTAVHEKTGYRGLFYPIETTCRRLGWIDFSHQQLPTPYATYYFHMAAIYFFYAPFSSLEDKWKGRGEFARSTIWQCGCLQR